jgi:cytidine deaminase
VSDRPELARPSTMSDADAELIDAARDLLDRGYRVGRHEVATAWRLADGAIVTGIHVDGSARRSAVCAEGVAAGNAIAHAAGQGEITPVEVIVSVLRRSDGGVFVIEPCGVCAELITDYWPESRVWVGRDGEIVAIEARELLPSKHQRVWV